MKNILITGANGFIGSFLTEKALESDRQVWAGIRTSSNREYLRDARIAFIELNYGDKENLKQQITEHVAAFGKWDYIVHNAGITKCLNPSDFDKVNFLYTQHFVEALQESNTVPDKFIYMSSLSVTSDEETAYGSSKLKAEQFLHSIPDFPYLIIRPTGVYGPKDKDYYLMLKMIRSGWDITAGSEPQQLTFIYVKDLAKAVFLALESQEIRKTYCISDGQVYSDEEFTRIAKSALGKKRVIRLRVPLFILKTVSTIAEMIAKLTKKPSTLNRDKYKIMKQRDWTCDSNPIRQDTGFTADYNLELGIRECVAWYRAQSWL
ncbi:NAD-dependent dehydratase [Bacteroidia bacterium]|nr:NAD-dependent dehydratase [Bacteroidia bacterium]